MNVVQWFNELGVLARITGRINPTKYTKPGPEHFFVVVGARGASKVASRLTERRVAFRCLPFVVIDKPLHFEFRVQSADYDKIIGVKAGVVMANAKPVVFHED